MAVPVKQHWLGFGIPTEPPSIVTEISKAVSVTVSAQEINKSISKST